MTNPFEQLRNDKEKENNQELENEIFNESIEQNTIVKTEEDEEEPALTLPPPILIYLLFSYFPIAAVIVIASIFLIGIGCDAKLAIPLGLVGGYTLRFSLQFTFRKLFAEPYVENTLQPFMQRVFGSIFTKQDLVKMVSHTSNFIRNKELKRNKVKTISLLKKGDQEFTLLGFREKNKSVSFALFEDGTPVPSIEYKYMHQSIRKLCINGFHGFWDKDLSAPEEFTTFSDEGVSTGTLIFETKEQAFEYVKEHETLTLDNLISLRTRAEIFRFLEIATQIRFDTIITMKDGTKFIAPAQDFMKTFQN